MTVFKNHYCRTKLCCHWSFQFLTNLIQSQCTARSCVCCQRFSQNLRSKLTFQTWTCESIGQLLNDQHVWMLAKARLFLLTFSPLPLLPTFLSSSLPWILDLPVFPSLIPVLHPSTNRFWRAHGVFLTADKVIQRAAAWGLFGCCCWPCQEASPVSLLGPEEKPHPEIKATYSRFWRGNKLVEKVKIFWSLTYYSIIIMYRSTPIHNQYRSAPKTMHY